MYSPTTRLLTVLALLQSHQHMSGAEIARRLAVDVRTVRRYITSLQDMGVPIEGERGPHGAYRLGRGSRMPPLMFTDEEAVALTLGLRAIREFQFPVNIAAVESAVAKTERILPEKLLQQVRGLQATVIFNHAPYATTPPKWADNTVLIALSSAAQEHRCVRLSYQSWQGEISERAFDPYGVLYNEGCWYTAGYCHLRQDLRIFRLDRIQSLAVLEQTFESPEASFDILGFVLNAIASTPARQAEILLKTSMATAEISIPRDLGTLEAAAEGNVIWRTTTNLEWVAMILLELDFPVEVQHPPELLDILRQIVDRANRIIGPRAR